MSENLNSLFTLGLVIGVTLFGLVIGVTLFGLVIGVILFGLVIGVTAFGVGALDAAVDFIPKDIPGDVGLLLAADVTDKV